MSATRRQLEEQVVVYSHRLHAAGFVANHDGNITVRLEDERWLATPTAFSKAAVTRESLIIVNQLGERVSGRHNPFSELALHLFIYRQRPDVRVVMHAHPPTATGLSVAGVAVRSTMMAEPVVSLGPSLPLVPYARPRTPEFTAVLGPHVKEADVWVLENHGVLTAGPDLETAYLRMELVEHLARIQLVAMQAGRVRAIPESDVATLSAGRAPHK